MTLALVLPVAAHAAAYKCTDTQGKITFSDTPCPANAAASKKIMERGAGYNPLTDEEKSEFKRGVMSGCTAPRNVCECFAETMADTLTFEEVQQAIRAGNSRTPSFVEQSKKALRTCQAREAQR